MLFSTHGAGVRPYSESQSAQQCPKMIARTKTEAQQTTAYSNIAPRSTRWSVAGAVRACQLMSPICEGYASSASTQVRAFAHLSIRYHRNNAKSLQIQAHVIVWCCTCVTDRLADNLLHVHCSQEYSRHHNIDVPNIYEHETRSRSLEEEGS